MSGMCVYILTRRTLAIGLPQNGRFMVYPSRVFPPRDVLSSLLAIANCMRDKIHVVNSWQSSRTRSVLMHFQSHTEACRDRQTQRERQTNRDREGDRRTDREREKKLYMNEQVVISIKNTEIEIIEKER